MYAGWVRSDLGMVTIAAILDVELGGDVMIAKEVGDAI